MTAIRSVYGERFRCAILKGSALTDDFVPYYSDIDVHVFVDDEALVAPRIPHDADAVALQAALAGVSPRDFEAHSFEIYFLPWRAGYPADWAKPWPGTYEVIYGELPGAFADADSDAATHLARAERHLGWFLLWTEELTTRIACARDDQLPELVRELGAILKPMLYVVVSLLTGDPHATWTLPLTDAMARGRTAVPDGSFDGFFAGLGRWPPPPESCRKLLASGFRVVRAVRGWDLDRRAESGSAAVPPPPPAGSVPRGW